MQAFASARDRGVRLAAARALAAWGLLTGAVQAQQTLPFTSAQVQAGRALYDSQCQRCHGAHLDDGEFAPALRGRGFSGRWAARPLSDLFALTQKSMPPDRAGSLSDTEVSQLLALVLSENAMTSGAEALPSSLDALNALHMPGQPGANGPGPSGGLAPGVPLPSWPLAASPLTALTPVTDDMLQAPAATDWLSWRGSLSDSGFSTLRAINRGNVGQLRLAWSLALPAGPNEVTPLVHDGVMFVHAYGDHVFALNASTGDALWHYARTLPAGISPIVERSLSLYQNQIFVGTSDSHLVALDARTGAVQWDQPVADPKLWRISGGPLVVQDRVMQGVVGRSPGGAFIVGLVVATGHEVWRFHSIAQPGDPGDATWNDTPLALRNGGSVWTAGSYDPELHLAFFGPGQTYDTAPLLHPVKRRGVSNDGLYLDSTVALDPETGKLKWYYQHLPNDQWDYDWAFERQLLQLPVNGHAQKLVMTSGKLGIYDLLDAATGHYVFSFDLGYQNLVTAIDPKTGAKTIDRSRYPDRGQRFTVCPHPGGGRSWLPGSYNADTHVVFAPMVESCMDMIPVAAGERGTLTSGVRWTLRARPGSDGRYGRVQAVDMQARKTLWTARQRAPQSSGVLATAGGLVFAGALDRRLTAYDDRNGDVLWSARLSDVPVSSPITFEADGKQYVAVTVGFGGPQSLTFPALVPEITLPSTRSASVWVFELP